jgi:hypothetical protein
MALHAFLLTSQKKTVFASHCFFVIMSTSRVLIFGDSCDQTKSFSLPFFDQGARTAPSTNYQLQRGA